MIYVGTILNYTLTSLKRSTKYIVTVSVRNTLHIGQPSAEVRTTTLRDGNVH
jgi:hypothetical protein